MNTTYFDLWDNQNGQYRVKRELWDTCEVAYRNWAERRIDTLVELTLINGSECRIAASEFRGMTESTPATRQASFDFDKAIKAEIPEAFLDV